MKIDRELESKPEYRRILAESPPEERLRLLGENFDLRRQLHKKREYRRMISELPTEKKLALLEELRNRAQLQQGSRCSASQSLQPETPPRFGGRATAGGVNYEVRIAASIAVKMLAGSKCSVWDGIKGDEVSAITMQAREPVDDIVVSLEGETEACIFISAKERSGSVALTVNSPAFADTMDAFVRQFQKLSSSARAKSRLIWAVPGCVGRAVTHDLSGVLNEHRVVSNTSLSDFLNGRPAGKKKALEAMLAMTTEAWKKQSGIFPTDNELQEFLRDVYVEVYDFGPGHQLQREIEGDIGSHIVADPKQAPRAWEKLEHFFLQANCHGVSVSPSSLRKALTTGGLALKSPPDYAEDIARLHELTSHNLDRLDEHTMLRFGSNPGDAVHIDRAQELSALVTAVKSGHQLITGEPGCGKSGLIHRLVETLQREGFPVVLLLAEEAFGHDWKGSANPHGLIHALDEVLANWPGGARGYLITDALDAVRDVQAQKMLRNLLRDVQMRQSGWLVIASVREFDLKYGRELREAFPGAGVTGYASNEFAGVAHFYLDRLSEAQLDALAAQRTDIRPFVESARESAKSGGIHRSPFYLRLAAELLRDGVTPERLADWNSPAVLLRRFWETRLGTGADAGERVVALRAICHQMVDTRNMTISLKEVSLGASALVAVDKLRSQGVLQATVLRNGMQVGGDGIRFTHHLLHDYAIARSLIPETPVPFCDFAVRKPLLPIFYRQSFMFALEELWDAPDERKGFWEAALKLESVTTLHSVTRILAPVLAARRVESLANLQPLLTAVGQSNDADSPGQKALRHLSSGLQDADPDLIRAGVGGWCAFAEQLANVLPRSSSIEGPLVHIVARLLDVVDGTGDPVQFRALNAAGRGLLAHHAAKDVAKGWGYAGLVAIKAICRTFSVVPTESEGILLTLLTPERLAQFPHNDLNNLADNLKYLGAQGKRVVLLLFEAAFATEPKPGEWEEKGSAILGLRFQTSDNWNSIHFSLAGYYEASTGENAALMTEAACIAWNAVVWRRAKEESGEGQVLATIQFHGASCELVEDYSHIWGREFQHEENRILTHFEKLLREWAASGDTARLNAVLDSFAFRNRTALMWTVLMEAGAEHPSTLGVLLENVLTESVFLIHPDYAYGGTALLEALHKTGNPAQRERLENLILDLPKNTWLPKDVPREPIPSWVKHAQDRLLGVLEEPNVVCESVRVLVRERQAENALPKNRKPERSRVTSHTLSDKEVAEERGINLKDPANDEMFLLVAALKPFLARNNNKVDVKEVERHWLVIQQCEDTLKRHAERHPKMAEELWGHLVGACESVVRYAEWPNTDERWEAVRRILLKAASDPMPRVDDNEEVRGDRCPSWGWPAPRIDAARGLPLLAWRLGHVDEAVTAALRQLCFDKSHALRFNLADALSVLLQPSPDRMWELMDMIIANDQSFSVLDAVLFSLNRLVCRVPEKVMPRLRLIADRAMQGASAESHIHTTLAYTYLFHFLRTGDTECEAFIAGLIADCDSQRASHALGEQLHACRQGGWLTAGDGVKPDPQVDAIRARTWSFFSKLLVAAQIKLQQHRDALEQVYKHTPPDMETAKPVKEKLDRVARLVDGIAAQLFFASGAFDEKNNNKERLTPVQLRRFWREASSLFEKLSAESHPHTVHQIVQALYHLLPYAPREVFLLATRSILSAQTAGFHYESLAVGHVVKLIQRALADHRDLFQSSAGQESECLVALLQVLDLFVEAGWAEARRLTHRLEEIYR